jgi:sirohydrochlorin cobaltochelatase
MATRSGIILFAHGSRTADWARPFLLIRDRVAAQRPEAVVQLAFLELMPPTFEEAVEAQVGEGVDHITVAPLFLAAGGHLRIDLPQLVDAALVRHPQLRIRVLPPIAESEALVQAIADWAARNAFDDAP